MDWNTFVEGFKEFWNQPVPIIGFTVGMCIVGVVFIIGKTSIGKKAFNKLKSEIKFLEEKNKLLLDSCEEYRLKLLDSESYIKELIKTKEAEVSQLKADYELLLAPYKEQIAKQDDLLKVVCENNVNKKVKEAYENYRPEVIDIPVPKIVNQIKAQYEDRLKALEDAINGKETKDN